MSVGLAVFALGSACPALREMKASFLITSLATVVFLVAGSLLFKDGEEDRKAVLDFHRRMEKGS